jgi:hypothetical protein
MPILRSAVAGVALGLVLTGGVVPSGAQTVEIVHEFTKAEPATGEWPPWAPIDLVRGEGGRLYGATRYGGADCRRADAPWSTCGVIFEVDPLTGAARIVHDLGYVPYEQTVRLSWFGGGEIYGTESNSPFVRGRLFKLTPTAEGPWESTVLHTFGTDTWNDGAHQWNYDGRGPHGPVMLAADGRLYGTTLAGGGLYNHQAQGSLYRIYPDGSGYESLYAFHTDNRSPSGVVGLSPMGALVTGADGHVYGTAFHGGSSDPYYPGYGTIFRYRGDTGAVEKVHSFDNTLVAYSPMVGLVRGPGGALFGTTASGSGAGTIYRMTVDPEAGASATVTILHGFAPATDAYAPSSELVLAPDGFLYGAAHGGPLGKGVVIRVRPDGTGYEHVHAFTGADGAMPSSALVLGADGNLYGTTREGGSSGGGVVYRVRMPVHSTIEGLIDRVEGLIADGALKLGQGKSLVGKLELALYMLEWGNTKKAITMLEAFIHEVKAFRNAGILEPDEADPLITIAEAAIASLAG